MRLTIQHTTHYHYAVPPKNLIQLLRLTPRNERHQQIVSWHITVPGNLTVFVDGLFNHSHIHTVHGINTGVLIVVKGVVQLDYLIDGCLSTSLNDNSSTVLMHLMPTDLTQNDIGIIQFAHDILPNGLNTPYDALKLALEIAYIVKYTPGMTNADSTASQAFKLSRGVCQDHAHIMIVACRALGIPARYVSGYVDSGKSHAAASHAWVDIYLNQYWYSIDVTNGIFASDAHCRLAIGRDYLDASPIRGIRNGGDKEQLNVLVNVHGECTRSVDID